MEQEGTVPNSSHKASIKLLPKSEDNARKKIIRQYCCLTQMQKSQTKIFVNQIQQYSRRIIYHNQVDFIIGMQEQFNICKPINLIYHVNKMQGKNLMIISAGIEKAIGKIEYPSKIKSLSKVGIEGIHLNIMKAIYNKPTVNIIFNGEKASPLISRIRKG